MKQVQYNGDIMTEIAICHQGIGDLIKRKPEAKEVYIINHYDEETDSYSCSAWSDMNKEIFIKSNKLVYVGFTF